MKTVIRTCFALLIAASPALASMGGGSQTPPQQPASVQAPDPASEHSPRQEAERDYGDAYQLVAKAKQDQIAGKTKNAEKKFSKALSRGEQAVATDSTYYEAWNLVGFCARMLRNYARSRPTTSAWRSSQTTPRPASIWARRTWS